MSTHAPVFVLLAFVSTVASASAQKVVGDADVLRASVTIQAIEPARRLITFRDDNGFHDTVQAPPEVKRFSELKVGDRVNLTYYQSRIFELKKRGSEPTPVGTTGTQIARADGGLPAAAVARQMTSVVTVMATDQTNGLIRVLTDDGRSISRKLDDKSLLNGVVADDKIEITYTQALLVEIER